MDEQEPTSPFEPPTSPTDAAAPGPFAPPSDAGAQLPPPPTPRWRPVRSDHGVIGGVAGGLSAATGVDVTLVRLAFIATALTGFGLIAYVMLWLILPKQDVAAGRAMTPAPPDTARWLRVALLVVPVLSLMGLVGSRGPWSPWHGAGWGVALVVIGVAVIVMRRRGEITPRMATAGGPTTVTPPTGGQGPAPTEATRAWWQSAPAVTAAPLTPAPLAPTRPSTSTALLLARVFAWLAVIGAIATGAALIVLERIDALSIQAPWLIVTLGVLAIGVIALAAIKAATAGPVFASTALLLVPAALVVGLGAWNGGVGDRVITPATVAEVEPSYQLAVGRLTIDLSKLALGGATVPVGAGTRIGSLEVVVPAGATLDVKARAGAGQVDVLGHKAEGLGARQDVIDTPSEPTGTIRLDLDVAAGRILLCRVPSAGTVPSSECQRLLVRTGTPLGS